MPLDLQTIFPAALRPRWTNGMLWPVEIEIRKQNLKEAVVGVAVATIPEGLPAEMTVTLTRNEMVVAAVATLAGTVTIGGEAMVVVLAVRPDLALSNMAVQSLGSNCSGWRH